ncbi:hypothetical protein E1H12_00865 [Geitlerinema sp. P-1104]|uniref:hypothetical protein n=1 Tax=Geitlerinema sp. P-1104 TaxID=2546230 RepID=UPI001476BDC4|nr:hypothetical protein [Geitlerinema sp. P-1104]NMG57104.1 hypothetical protein [Geitlerinema sp. P-1104]
MAFVLENRKGDNRTEKMLLPEFRLVLIQLGKTEMMGHLVEGWGNEEIGFLEHIQNGRSPVLW